ncbi:hypothetical protein [Microcoleus sp. herbarium12]
MVSLIQVSIQLVSKREWGLGTYGEVETFQRFVSIQLVSKRE